MNFKRTNVLATFCLSLILLGACAGQRASLISEAERGNLEGVRQLVANGSAIDDRGANNKTPLMVASGAGRTDVVAFLLEHGADVHKKDSFGFTALAWALEKFHVDIAALLLQKGADINAQSASGQTVLMRALYQGNDHVVQFLIQNGADVNLTDNQGFGALTVAVVKDDLDAVKMLIQQGAKIETESSDGVTPLMSAAYHRSSKVFSFLMEKEPDTNKLTKKDWSALTFAAMGAGDTSKEFDPSIMQQLIDAGASAEIKDINGKSIIELAESEAYFFERKKNKLKAEERQKSARGMNQMSVANFTGAIDNLWAPVSVSNRVKKIKAILESTQTK